MILTQEFLGRQASIRDINEYSENRIMNENAMFSKNNSYDLFISHSFFDKKLVLTLVQLFNDAQYSVYVDWINDSSLDRKNVTSETAKIIRKRIAQCKGLAYIATKNIVSSKWCPWELGLGDGINNGRSCILPVMQEGSSFRGTEYIGMYPYIEYESDKFWVVDQNDSSKYTSLRNWLAGYSLKV
ncbi:MAG: TIR domain-containing protein [Acidaminococcaceae bacterium]